MKLVSDEIYNILYKCDASEGKVDAIRLEENFTRCYNYSKNLFTTVKNLADQCYGAGLITKQEHKKLVDHYKGIRPQKDLTGVGRWIAKRS